MEHADALVAAYVGAGFTKIHLDCSFACAGDPTPADRRRWSPSARARLIRVAEDAARSARRRPAQLRDRHRGARARRCPRGARARSPPTSAAGRARDPASPPRGVRGGRRRRTSGRASLALVVQPGVEFDHQRVFDYQPELPRELQRGPGRRAGDGLRGALDRLPDRRRR